MVQSLAVSDNRFYATGKRKSSIARVWLKVGSGNIVVNGKKYNEYFKRPVLQLSIEKPFNVVNKINGYDVNCTVKGGGLTGQAGRCIFRDIKSFICIRWNIKKNIKKRKVINKRFKKS